MAELKKVKSNVYLVGKIKLFENSFQGIQVSASGFNYCRVSFGIETSNSEGNVIYGEVMGGYYPNNPVLSTMSKENQSFDVNWADRHNKAIIDSVADYKLLKCSIEKDESGKTIQKKFINAIDYHDYLKEHLKDGMEVIVRGGYEYSRYNDNDQKKFVVNNIYLPKLKEGETELKYHAELEQTVILIDDSVPKITKAEKENGEVVVRAYVVDYVSKYDGKEIKKNILFSFPITVKLNKDNLERSLKLVNGLFKVPKGKVREMGVVLNIVEGYEKAEVNPKDIEISDEIRDLIDMGFWDEEEVLKKLTVQGTKVSKMVFLSPSIAKNDNGVGVIQRDDTKYQFSDLVFEIPTEDEESEGSIEDDMEDFDGLNSGDDAWMSELGI